MGLIVRSKHRLPSASITGVKPILALLVVSGIVSARETPKLPDDPYFAAYALSPAPEPGELMLKKD